MANVASPKGVIITMTIGSLVVVTVQELRQGGFPPPQRYIATFVAFMVIGAVADFSPQLGTSLAVLVFIGMLLANGQEALEGLDAYMRSQKRRKKRNATGITGPDADTTAGLSAQQQRQYDAALRYQ